MTAPAPTFAEWAARLELPSGARFELEPWQRRMLEDLEAGVRPLDPGELELAQRRAFRRYRAALMLASAALGGQDVFVPAVDRSHAEDLATFATRILRDFGRAAGVDVELACRRLARAPRQAGVELAVDERHRHDPSELTAALERLERTPGKQDPRQKDGSTCSSSSAPPSRRPSRRDRRAT